MKRVVAGVAGLALALIGTIAVAAWLGSGSGAAFAAATSVNQGHAPTATRGPGTVTLTWTASTLASGSPVTGYTVLRHAGATTTTACTATSPTLTCIDPAPLGSTVTYGVVPTVGAHWTGPESTTTSFTYDNVGPNTTASLSPTPNGAGWNKTSVTVTLNATDPAISSGVDHVTYTVDGGSAVNVAGSATSFAVSGTGSHIVTFFAVDGAGNVESTNSTTIKIDPDAPLVTNLKPVSGASGSWTAISCSNADRVCADVTDLTSGIATNSVTFSLTGTSGTNAGKCWNGSSFVAPACAQQPMSVLSGSQYGSAATLTAALMGAGNYTLVVTATDVAGNIGTATSTFTVKADQTISFTSTAPTNAAVGGATYTVSATATSGLAVTFTSATPSVCTVAGSTVSFVGTGTCTINANQVGDSTWNAAPQVQQSFAVKANQTITFTQPTTPATATTTAGLVATSTSGLTVTFTSITSSVCSVSGTTVSYVTSGTCTIVANQTGNSTYNAAPPVTRDVTVNKANQTITFTQPTTPATAATTAPLSAFSTSGLAVVLTSATTSVCTVSGTTVTYLISGTCTLSANQAGDATYNSAAQVQRTVTVNKAPQTITFAQPTTPANAGTSATLVASSTSGLTVAFTTTSAATICTITGGTTVNYVGAGNCVINANQAGDGTYNTATQVQRTVVVQAPFTITGKTDGSPQNSTRIQGTGTPGATVTVYICAGTVATCGPGSATLDATSPQTATVLANGTWNSSVFTKLGTGTFTAQAVQTTPSATSNAFTFTNS